MTLTLMLWKIPLANMLTVFLFVCAHLNCKEGFGSALLAAAASMRFIMSYRVVSYGDDGIGVRAEYRRLTTPATALRRHACSSSLVYSHLRVTSPTRPSELLSPTSSPCKPCASGGKEGGQQIPHEKAKCTGVRQRANASTGDDLLVALPLRQKSIDMMSDDDSISPISSSDSPCFVNDMAPFPRHGFERGGAAQPRNADVPEQHSGGRHGRREERRPDKSGATITILKK